MQRTVMQICHVGVKTEFYIKAVLAVYPRFAGRTTQILLSLRIKLER